MHINSLELLAATEVIHEECDRLISPTTFGQHNCCSIYQQQRGYSLPPANWPCKKFVDVGTLDQGIMLQHDRRCRVQNVLRSLRLDAMPAVFQAINKQLGPLEVDLFATRLTHQLFHFFSWRLDPLAEATDAGLEMPTLHRESPPPDEGIGSPFNCTLVLRSLGGFSTKGITYVFVKQARYNITLLFIKYNAIF